jgi:hypothetical protein
MEEPIIVEGSVVHRPDAYRPPAAVGAEPAAAARPSALSVPPVAPTASTADPEFDAYLAVVKTLLGGAVEGTAELARRLERLEAQLQAGEDGPPGPGEVNSTADVVRYMLFGASLAAADGLRQRAVRWAEASDVLIRTTGSAIAPLASSRLTRRVVGPFDRAFGRLVARGQSQVNTWVELGRANEPTARLLARQAYLEAVDDFIGHLSQNQQLSDLVQEQSIGLATEFVEEVRERTVSADTLAESIVRRILKRPPRTALPPPDAIREAVAEVKRVPRYED